MPRDRSLAESSKRSRFVLLCQQLLAFAAVLAIAAPAAGVVTLDIVAPSDSTASARAVHQHAGAGSLVADEAVKPTVREVPMNGIAGVGLRTLARGSSVSAARLRSSLAALTDPEPVAGFATVGVTWRHGVTVPDGAISISVRTRKDGLWSGWEKVPYDAEHGPDPGSEEARHARPGTDPVAVGTVDDVQVKAVTADGTTPPGMELALVDPGTPSATSVERPAIDTAKMASAETGTTTGTPTGTPGDVTPKPTIYSRGQWGADESMRDKSSLHYGEVHAGFVHHTVNANGYTRAEVPAIIRGI
ncbi:MAG: hypothetical protein ACXVW9_14940, partial [Nocardioidaceae bacterium]